MINVAMQAAPPRAGDLTHTVTARALSKSSRWCIHRDLDVDGAWTVSHRPTGGCLFHTHNAASALGAARALDAMGEDASLACCWLFACLRAGLHPKESDIPEALRPTWLALNEMQRLLTAGAAS